MPRTGQIAEQAEVEQANLAAAVGLGLRQVDIGQYGRERTSLAHAREIGPGRQGAEGRQDQDALLGQMDKARHLDAGAHRIE